MTHKPNWACGTCGMFSPRKESVKRHVRNLHGQGPILRFIDYLTGRHSGFYTPSFFPTFERKEPQQVDNLELAGRAFQDGFWHEAGREACRLANNRLTRKEK
jgi:hypothetical protein